MVEKVHISPDGEFIDSNKNQIQLRGVNLDPTIKFPSSPEYTSHDPVNKEFFNPKAKVNYINHPFTVDDVEEHIQRLKSLGYNTIRYPFTWESLEHDGPGIYDFEFMDFTISVLKKIRQIGGIRIYLDPHQDVWSRFTGGSGAPLWTLYSAGFNPEGFQATEAAILQNYYIDSSTGEEKPQYPKMLWPTNYFRLAAQTMFTLFFGGREFAPKCIINGKNIQDYLQQSFCDAVMIFYARILKNAPELFEENYIIGLETMNEPNNGYFIDPDLSQIPKDRKLKRGTTPTAFQCFKLGEGIATVVDTYDISVFGPRKTGVQTVDPKGKSAWLSQLERNKIDEQFKWKRGEEWEAGKCIWRQHGVWEITDTQGPKIVKPQYFYRVPGQKDIIDMRYFVNHYFLEHYLSYREEFRKLDQSSFLFLQPPTLQEPPNLAGTNYIDKKTVYACHFYDGMSLMFKTWNRTYNVDTFGIMRGRYKNPIFSIVLGEANIRKSIRNQLLEMKQEGKRLLGSSVPVFFTEIGMPFDMDDKKAYKDGNFASQTSAMDALGFALEGSNLSFSLWCYCSHNDHKWGDYWNNEDFSIWSKDDLNSLPVLVHLKPNDGKEFKTRSAPIISSNESTTNNKSAVKTLDYSGIRALKGILRPYPVKIHGVFESADFDLSQRSYNLKIKGRPNNDESHASLLFLPKYHFPLGDVHIKASSGQFQYDPQQQVLKWFHEPGHQYITISNLGSEQLLGNGEEPEGCALM
ncbi:LAFE_0F05578g1_1 [Lachancea fermentati]|uniref:LAFE_0F05578g1_1 n=1 Tax=Lachancea fermentati TaxID=4955 RepID=A0A1G4MF78_LACFM|nr:LAFE_0F05578g1_1 [Lachancea fermentati]